jgi:hypothetical protein
MNKPYRSRDLAPGMANGRILLRATSNKAKKAGPGDGSLLGP